MPDEKTPTSPTPSNAVPANQELQEKNVKKAFLEKFNLVKTESSQIKDVGSELKAEPKANTTDPKEIYQSLNEINKKEFLIIKFKPQIVFLIFGILISLMWLIGGGKFLIESKLPRFAIWDAKIQAELKAAAAITPTPVASPSSRIRLRNHNNATSSATELISYLKDQGFPGIELVDDPDSIYTGVSIVVKNDQLELKSRLENVLASLYKLSSPSAELSLDSDFDALILFGEGATLSAHSASASATPSATITPTKRPTPVASASATP